MKKLFVALLAVAGLTACFNEEVVNVADQRTPIAFDSFTDKVTRVNAPDPSSTTANLTEFYVWGVMDEADGVVFDDERVYGGVGAWTYAQQQYWAPGHNYYFAAFAGDRTNNQIVFDYANAAKNGMSLDGLGTATFKNVAGINDFLYAEFAATTPAVIDSQDDVDVVNFAFDHLLSKVKFTFKNGFINDNITVLVKNVKMEVPAQGTIDLTANAYNWTNLEGTTILDMGDMAAGAKIAINGTASSDNERLTIPAAASQEYTVTFYVESWQGDVLSTSATKVVKITNCLLEPGKAYNFVATLDHTNVAENPLFPIVFDCTVDEWETEEYDGGVIKTENVPALSEDISGMTLVADAIAVGTLNLNGTFDGGNNTLFARMTSETVQVTAGTAPIILAEGPSTVRNLIIDGENLRVDGRGIRAFVLNAAGDYVIENVVIRNVLYCLNTVASFDTLTVKNSTFEGWTSFTGTSALFENVSFEIGAYGNIKPYCSTVLRNCSFEDGFMIDFSALPADATITLDQCTYNNQVLTAETFASAVTDGDYTGKVIFK